MPPVLTLPAVADRVIHSWPTDHARHWLAAFLARAREDRNVLAVVVVGSAIRPGVASDDLDLVVLCRDRRLFSEKAPIEVDLRSFDLAAIDTKLKLGHDLLAWSLRLGVPIHDPQGIWAELRNRWKDRLPLPDVSVANQRAESTLAQLNAMRAAGDADAVVDLSVSYYTHLARAALAGSGVFPSSRPELPDQLRSIGREELASRLSKAMRLRADRRMAPSTASQDRLESEDSA